MSARPTAWSVGQSGVLFGELSAGPFERVEIPSVDLIRKAPLRKPEKVACSHCARIVERVDEEFGQCLRCNADEIHEAARLTIFETLSLERSRRFALTEEEWDVRREREQPDARGRKETFA